MRRCLIGGLLAVGAVVPVAAWECAYYTHDYVVGCQAGRCRTDYGVMYAPVGPRCDREPVIVAVDSRVDAYLGAMAAVLSAPRGDGLYQVHLVSGEWHDDGSDPFERLLRELSVSLPGNKQVDQIRLLTPAHAAAQLPAGQHLIGIEWLGADASPAAAQARRDELQSDARWAALWRQTLEVLVWVIPLLGLLGIALGRAWRVRLPRSRALD